MLLKIGFPIMLTAQNDTNSCESEFVRHLACPNCGSSDANSLYSDGHTFCFVCHHRTKGDGESHIHQTNMLQLIGEPARLISRKISQKTAEKFRTYSDGNVIRHYYFEDGQIVGAKVRTKDKTFTCEGTVKSLFGSHLFRRKAGKDQKLIITEGEIDAMAVYEANPGWPVVSIPSGAAGAKKAIQHNFEFINEYDKIVLFFDNDEAGRKAAEECAGVLPPSKTFIGFLSDYKDASEALMNQDYDSIRNLVNYDHTQYKPDGIVEGKSLLSEITTPNPPNDHDYPYDGLQRLLHGIRYGELVTITAGSGIGKSSFCRELATSLLQKGERVGYLALEESNRRTALGLMSSAVGESLHLGNPEVSKLIDAFDQTIANWNLFLFDGFGSYDPDVIYNRIEYLASGLDCKVIFLDHLSILMSGLEGDERRMIDSTMTRLRSLVERTGIALFLVSHLKRTSGDQNHEEGARVTLGQLRGSAAIAQLSDAVIGLERNQQSNEAGNATTVRVLKNRYSGETGIACTLSYDLDTCKFNETSPEKEFDPATDF